MNATEKEVKFLIGKPEGYLAALERAGAKLVEAREKEINLRFDTADGQFIKTRRVLRLRQDHAAHLTFKGAPLDGAVVSARQEIEFEASDFESARAFLEALGYIVSVIYEKYRTSYHLGNCVVTLDELPFGKFSEIEGPDENTIAAVAHTLGLNWEHRVLESYMGLFSLWKQRSGHTMRDLTFEEFRDIPAASIDLELKPADS